MMNKKNGFLRHSSKDRYKKKDIPSKNIPSILAGSANPGRLLHSRAYFRFTDQWKVQK